MQYTRLEAIKKEVQQLTSFTGYAASFVAAIFRRMHEAGLWQDGAVETDHWFESDKWTVGLWSDTLVAEGVVVARRSDDGQWEYRV